MKCGSQKEISELSNSEMIKQAAIVIGEFLIQNDITDISFLNQCKTLQRLTIDGTKITHLPLQNMKILKYLNIGCCKNLQTLNGLEDCHELEEMHINFLNISSIEAIQSLKKLKKLQIWNCKQIADYDTLEQCKYLNCLQIQGTNISNILSIANLNNLETIKLLDNQRLPKEFHKNIQNCKKEIQQLLKGWRKTQNYKDYVTEKQGQKPRQLRITLNQLQQNIQQFKDNINKQILQYKINLVKSMEKIIEYQ